MTVAGPLSSQVVTETVTLRNLPPGSYQIASRPVTQPPYRFTSAPGETVRALTPGDSVGVTLTYSVAAVTITLPAPTLPGTLASTPDLATGRLLRGTTVVQAGPLRTLGSDLQVGQYVLAVDTIARNDTLWAPTPATATLTVSGPAAARTYAWAATVSPHDGMGPARLVTGVPTISYTRVPGRFRWTTVTPPDAPFPPAEMALLSPAGDTVRYPRDSVRPLLMDGLWRVLPAHLTAANGDGFVYAASPDTIRTRGSQVLERVVLRQATTGRVQALLTGVPTGATPTLALRNPDNNEIDQRFAIDATSAQPVPAGAWTLDAAPIVREDGTWDALNNGQSVSVIAGETQLLPITYAPRVNYRLVHLEASQAIQNPAGSAALLASRTTQIRAYGSVDVAGAQVPEVAITLSVGGTPYRTLTMTPPMNTDSALLVAAGDRTPAMAWTAVLAPGDVRVGMEIRATINPNGTAPETIATDNAYPADSPLSLTVLALPPMETVFVPVTFTSTGQTGDVNPGNLEEYLSLAREVLPAPRINARIRAPFVTNLPPLQPNDANEAWVDLIFELLFLQLDEGAAAEYYHGIVPLPDGYGGGIAGLGFVPGRAALTADFPNAALRAYITAHELGHNLNASHAPACTPGDNNFPYADDRIGHWGWNSHTNLVVDPSVRDMMGYCQNARWISDYHWNRMTTYRVGQNGAGLRTHATEVPAPDAILVVAQGVVRNDGTAVLHPLLAAHGASAGGRARATAPLRFGRVPSSAGRRPDNSGTLVFRDADERVIAHTTVALTTLDHRPDVRVFQEAVALPLAVAAQIHSTELVQAGVTRARRVSAATSTAAAMTTDGMAVDGTAVAPLAYRAVPMAAGAKRVTWDGTRWPRVVVRDAATGTLLTILRDGRGIIPANPRALRLEFSDGVHIRRAQP